MVLLFSASARLFLLNPYRYSEINLLSTAPPFTKDKQFKRLFENKELLIHFLHAIQPCLKDQVRDITFLNPVHSMPRYKQIIFDLFFKDQDDRFYIIELQNAVEPYFHRRAMYYISRVLSTQLMPGQDYKQMRSVSLIGLLNYPLSELRDCSSTAIKTDLFALELFSIYNVNDLSQNSSRSQKWLYLIKYFHLLKEIPKALAKDPEFSLAVKVANELIAEESQSVKATILPVTKVAEGIRSEQTTVPLFTKKRTANIEEELFPQKMEEESLSKKDLEHLRRVPDQQNVYLDSALKKRDFDKQPAQSEKASPMLLKDVLKRVEMASKLCRPPS